MKTWSIVGFDGYWPVGTSAVVTAETVAVAITLLEERLAEIGLPQTIKPEQLVPVVRSTRWVRILQNGDY